MKFIYLTLIPLLAGGCATSFVEVVAVDGTKIKATKNSFFRKGPYIIGVEAPVAGQKQKIEITIAGNDEAMSGNLALVGALIGGAAAGPEGAAAGGIVGGLTDIYGKIKGYFKEDPTKEVPTIEEPEVTPPKEDVSSKAIIPKPKRVLRYSSKTGFVHKPKTIISKPKRVLVYSSRNPQPIKPVQYRKPITQIQAVNAVAKIEPIIKETVLIEEVEDDFIRNYNLIWGNRKE